MFGQHVSRVLKMRELPADHRSYCPAQKSTFTVIGRQNRHHNNPMLRCISATKRMSLGNYYVAKYAAIRRVRPQPAQLQPASASLTQLQLVRKAEGVRELLSISDQINYLYLDVSRHAYRRPIELPRNFCAHGE